MLNQIKTVLLLGGLSGLLLLIGMLVGGPTGLTIGLIFAIGINFFSYWFSEKMALMAYKAVPLDENVNREIFEMTRDLCRRMDLPMPKLYVLPAQNLNAFATGRNANHASVAMTDGIIQALSKEELKGVIAHELAHIKNRDILISSIAATIAAVISYVAFMARWATLFSGFGGNRDDGPGFLELIVLAIVAPLMATVIRSREYLADETGARAMRSGAPLADALQKLHDQKYTLKSNGTTNATSHMFIVNPFKGKSWLHMFSTHPDPEERMRRLRALRF
jgi:heat shock protein HtpX